jgi:AcrR family transcriptional regulator
LAIFEAAERLLANVPLHDISVADIIKEAKVARATFYFYFSSKYAVVVGLLERVMDEIYDVVQPFRDRAADEPPETALRRSLEASTVVWSAHRAAIRATVEHWHAIPELGDLWLGVVKRFTAAVAAEIDRQRGEGSAPPGVDSRQLAAGVIWATERILYIGGLGVDEDLPGETDTVDMLMALWLGALYGAPSPADRAP